jgi:hypothetical protein
MYGNTDPEPAPAPKADFQFNPKFAADRRAEALAAVVNQAVASLVAAIGEVRDAVRDTKRKPRPGKGKQGR